MLNVIEYPSAHAEGYSIMVLFSSYKLFEKFAFIAYTSISMKYYKQLR